MNTTTISSMLSDGLECFAVEVDSTTLRVLDLDREDKAFFGYTRDDWHAKPEFLVHQFIHPDDCDAVVARLVQTREGEQVELLFRAMLAGGQTSRVRALLRLVRADDRGALRFRGLLMPAGEVLDATYRRNDERLALALESAKMGVWDWNVEQSALFWSDQVYKLHEVERTGLGTVVEDFLHLIDRVHPDDMEVVEQQIRSALASGDDYDIEYRFRIANGSYRWLYVKGRIFTDEVGNPVRIAGTVQDISAQKAAEQALRELTEGLERRVQERTEALERANKMLRREIQERVRAERSLERANRALRHSNRELQHFAYVASHDLQEPLRKITTFADLVAADCGDGLSEDGRFYLGRMQESAERMTRLISDLLNYSRVRTLAEPFSPTDLKVVVEQVLSDLQIRIQESGGTVRVDDLPTIEADPTQMRQLFQNLISNALKFRRVEEPPVVEVGIETNGEIDPSLCRIVVRDNGIGFDLQYRDRIFSPFQRLNPGKYEGTGIGLAICRRIVERHQGTIDVTSAPGAGTAFSIQLPICREAHDAGA